MLRFDAPQWLLIPPESLGRLLQLITRLSPILTEHALIRIGPDGDGGYLVPDDLSDIVACYSPGVSTTIGFDLECAKRGMKVFLADASVDGPPVEHPGVFFTKKFLSCWEDSTHTTLDDWVLSTQSVNEDGDLLLQMDIEGSEYQALGRMSDALLSRFRIIVIEFHDLDQLWNKGFLLLVEPLFDKLLKGHYCVHLHPNNCCGSVARNGIEIPRVMEFTFIRKDRVFTLGPPPAGFPHHLDADNTPGPTLVLPECWWNPAVQQSLYCSTSDD
jgi:hypothetical protein